MIKKLIGIIFNKFGYQISKIPKKCSFHPDMEEEFKNICQKTAEYTLTPVERTYALYTATKYIVNNNIPGEIVECGVWKGGSSMVCALTLKKLNSTNRKIYLYDTYEGMSMPTEVDIRYDNFPAKKKWMKLQQEKYNKWWNVPVNEVKKNLYSTGYPSENILFIKGKVENTIPKIIPDEISILRLDTDWYESTYHELKHLYPKLSKHGIIIIDDYGHWKGAKAATDQYFTENRIEIFLQKIDRSARIGIKIT